MIFHLFCQNSLLDLITVLEHLLNDIVAKDIGHELKGIRLHFAEQLLLLITVCGLKLLLNET